MAELGPKLAERVQGAVQRAAQSPEVQAAMKNLKDTAQQLDFARQVATALSGAAADYMTEHVAALFEGLAEQLPYKEEIQRARTTVAKLLHVDLVSSVWAGMKAGLAHIAQSQAMQMFEGWAAGRMREASTTALDVLVGKVGGEIAPLREQFDTLVASAAEPLEQVKKISDAVVISPLQKLGKHGVDMVMGGEPTLDTKAWAAQGASVFGQQEGKLLMEAREKVAEEAGAESLVSLDNFLIAMKLASDMRKLEKVKEGHEVVSVLLKAVLETGATVVTAGLGKKTLLTAVAKVAGVKSLEQLLDPVSRSVWDATLDLATHEDRDDGLMLPQQDRAIAQATVLFVCTLPVVARFASPVTERLAKVAALPGTVASYAGGQAARFAGAAASTAASALPDGGPISPFGRALGSAGSWLSSFGGTGAAADPAASGPEQTVTIDAKELAAVIEEWESEVIQAVAPGAGASQPKSTSRGDDWQI